MAADDNSYPYRPDTPYMPPYPPPPIRSEQGGYPYRPYGANWGDPHPGSSYHRPPHGHPREYPTPGYSGGPGMRDPYGYPSRSAYYGGDEHHTGPPSPPTTEGTGYYPPPPPPPPPFGMLDRKRPPPDAADRLRPIPDVELPTRKFSEPSELEHLGKWKAEIERLTKAFVQGQNEGEEDSPPGGDLLSGLGLHKILEKTIQEKLKDVFQKYQPNPSRKLDRTDVTRNLDRKAETTPPPPSDAAPTASP